MPAEEQEETPASPATPPRVAPVRDGLIRDGATRDTAPPAPPAPEPAPKGLRGLLRRQTSLPLPDRGRDSAGAQEEENRGSFLPLGERREGIFEIKAAEGPPEKP